MIGSSSGHLVDDRYSRQPFLSTHRALAVCAREFARVSDEVVRAVAALPRTAVDHKPTARQSPSRCIVQLGPVALTIAWLRSPAESIATGELLAIVWRGSVAPRQKHEPERPPTGRAPLPATPLWEQVLTAVADDERSWAWQPRDGDVGGCSSTELAARCVERLRVAYLETGEDPGKTNLPAS
jgi:hypothetical protein